ncbi:guanylate kinase [Blastomonas natatoria]|uniref:Guanylate kinase n=1 Tax=Blastomonas natatoria TaxID=34015 RepID=A0A2V3V339_9SPHN|nr:guanylate kinase [Blastomonas natatoria]PXW75238.1 guanylate kinase [Blastomonas natatoria]
MVDTVIQAPLARRGLLFILSSPSGAGKSTIARMLLEQDGHIALSVSVTTRPPRPGEVDGQHYHFIDESEFHRLVEENALLEWAKVFGHYYGTPKAQVKQGLREGQDFLFDIDWQGTQQLYQRAEGDVVRVFILPPSLEELHRRLRSRNTDSEEVIAGRMARAQDEISHWDGYDFVVINDNVDNCFEKVRQILNSERMRRARQTGLIDYVRDLMNAPAP